ncbi:MAG: hypothetical protein JNG90_18055 [Planctomycetaceae bacterium]|nr:hypothetical protein [Planctomycetaceae bacterium]
MASSVSQFQGWRVALGLASCLTLGALTGCQVDVGGQTLPSPYYLDDDIQYFPAGPEFKLPQEAAAMRAEAEEARRLENRQSRVPVRSPAAMGPPMGAPMGGPLASPMGPPLGPS